MTDDTEIQLTPAEEVLLDEIRLLNDLVRHLIGEVAAIKRATRDDQCGPEGEL